MKAKNNTSARNHDVATSHSAGMLSYLLPGITRHVHEHHAAPTPITKERSRGLALHVQAKPIALVFQLFACALLVLFTSSDVLAADPAKIFADDGTKRARFGSQIALSDDGNTVVVGAPKTDPNAPPGEAYVFTNQDGWRQVATLTASDSARDNDFGGSVGISGDGQTVVVGAPGATGKNNEGWAGAAYVFAAQGGWKQVAKLTSSNPLQNANFGKSVSILGPAGGTQYVVAGAPGADKSKGAAYLFVSLPKGAWESATENYRLIVNNRKEGDKFGYAASFDRSGDQGLVVSAYWVSDAAYKAYVFLPPRGKNGWQRTQNGDQTEVAILAPKDSKATLRFGASVSFSGNTVVVGAADIPWEGGTRTKGAVYVFLRPDGGWEHGKTYNETAVLTAKNGKAGDCLGWSVSTNGYQVLAGAGWRADGAGAAYLFTQTDTGWAEPIEIAAPAEGKGRFGWSVSISATANEYVLAVSALRAKGKVDDSGAAFIFAKPPKKPGVKLDQSTSPNSGIGGVNYLALSGSGFPDGSISPDNVAVQLSTVCHGPASAITPAASLVSSSGDSRLVSFLLPASLPPGNYFVSISDSADGDANFESSNCSGVTVSQ